MSTKISCKKLSRIEQAIKDEIQHQFNLTDWGSESDKSSAASAGRVKHRELFTKFNTFTEVVYSIREIKRKFNEDRGINSLTLGIASLEDRKNFLLKPTPSVRRIRLYGSEEPVEYSVGLDSTSEAEVRAIIRGIDRDIQSLKDRCNVINSKVDIELPEEVFKFLQKNQFI